MGCVILFLEYNPWFIIRSNCCEGRYELMYQNVKERLPTSVIKKFNYWNRFIQIVIYKIFPNIYSNMWMHYTKRKKKPIKSVCLEKGTKLFSWSLRAVCGPGEIIPTIKMKYKWHNIKIIGFRLFSIAHGLDEQINK